MLYKVTPMMPGPEAKPKKAREPGQPRKKRKSAIYDHEGNEVLITLMCLKCRTIKPLMQFGLRKMADGAIRNQPWCRGCRSGAGTPKPKPSAEQAVPPETVATEPAVPMAADSANATEVPVPMTADAEDTVPVTEEPVEAASEGQQAEEPAPAQQ